MSGDGDAPGPGGHARDGLSGDARESDTPADDRVTDDRRSDRERMVETVASRTGAGDDVLRALEAVPRHAFVPPDRRDVAYEDYPLSIGDGQTISAPHMVAIMADLLDLEPGTEILEIGTGCGYHAAVTAELVGDENVSSVEYSSTLAERARTRLADCGYEGVRVRVGDGRNGWPDHAPYDAAYFTCAVPEFPDPVVEQVRSRGQLLAPVGTDRQTLVRARRHERSGLERSDHGGVRFVRMRG